MSAATNRHCGTCTLCCRLLPVRGLDKPHNTRCRHQSSKGCAVYHQPQNGFPVECGIWNCRWLVDPDGGKLRRPDRAHYVVDVMPDLIRVRNKETGEVIEMPVIQVWADPAYPDAWRDPALFAYAEGQGEALLVRFNPQKAIGIFPPAVTGDGQWHEVIDHTILASPSGSMLLDKLKRARGQAPVAGSFW